MTLVVRGGTIIDGTASEPRRLGSLVMENGRITRIGGEPPRGAEVLDVDGMTVLPGLIDAHSHLGLVRTQDPGRMSLAVTAAHIFRNADLALDSGFTTVRDCGGVDGGLREAIDTGLVRGPRLFPSGPLIAQTGGHADVAPRFLDHHGYHTGWPGLTQVSMIADGPDAVRLAAREVFRRGATQVKLAVSGGVVSISDRVEDAQFSVEEIRAAVEEAAARDSYVTVHAHSLAGIRNALAAGVRSFEHGSFLDEPTAREMAEAGAFLVPTLAVLRIFLDRWREWGVPEESLPRVRSTEAAMIEAVRIASEAGVAIASGSDLIGPDQAERGLEIALKADVVGPMEAIVSATATNARLLRVEDRLGTLEVGKLADVVVVNGDPLVEPQILARHERVALVVKDGMVVKDARA